VSSLVYAAHITVITDTGNMRTIPGYKEVRWHFRSTGLKISATTKEKAANHFQRPVASRQNNLPTMVAGRETVNPAISLFLLRMMTLISCTHKNEIISITMRDHSFCLLFFPLSSTRSHEILVDLSIDDVAKFDSLLHHEVFFVSLS